MARKKDGLNDKDIVDFISAQKDQARTERETTLEPIWKEVELLYQNKHDFSKKKDWQAKMFYSMVSPTVNRASRMIKQMLMKTEDYFTMDYVGEEDIPLARSMQDGCKFYLNNAKFPERFSEACGSGFLYCIGILKIYCQVVKKVVLIGPNGDERSREVTELMVKLCNPWDCYWPRDWGFFIEDCWTTIPDLLNEAEERGFDAAEIRRAIGNDYADGGPSGEATDQEKARLRRLGIDSDSTNDYRKPALLSNYWGPLINSKGKMVAENQSVVLLNEQYVIKGPKRNPFADQKWPYVFITPLKMLFRHFGEGLTWGVHSIAKELTNTLNLMSDSLKFNMAGVIEVNEDMLTERDRNRPMEIYPGKTVRRHGDARGRAMEHHELGADPERGAGFVTLLRSIFQNHTGITEWLMGAPTLKGSTTATEVSTKSAMGQSDFEAIAEDIDRQGIVEAVEKTKNLIVQYYTDISSYPNVRRILEQRAEVMMQLTPEQKMELLLGDWDIRPRGLSMWFERKEQINKLRAHNDFLKTIPPEIAMANVDWKTIGESWSEALWGDKDKFWKEQEQGPPMLPQGQETLALPGGQGTALPPPEEQQPLLIPGMIPGMEGIQ